MFCWTVHMSLPVVALLLLVLASTGWCSVPGHPTTPTFEVSHPADVETQKTRGAGEDNLITMSAPKRHLLGTLNVTTSHVLGSRRAQMSHKLVVCRFTGKAAHTGSPGGDHRPAVGQELLHQSNGLAGGLTLPPHDARDCIQTGIGLGQLPPGHAWPAAAHLFTEDFTAGVHRLLPR